MDGSGEGLAARREISNVCVCVWRTSGSHEAQGTEAEPEGLAKQLASLGGPEGKSLKQRGRQSKLLELNGNDGGGPFHQQVPAR